MSDCEHNTKFMEEVLQVLYEIRDTLHKLQPQPTHSKEEALDAIAKMKEHVPPQFRPLFEQLTKLNGGGRT